ncbi:MAG: class I fructose-bisphosphate aldolase [Acidimicrobiales bacterium]
MNSLERTAAALVCDGKGILAADESVGTISKRFEALGIHSSQEIRRQYRELLLGAPGIEAHVSGAILYDETIRQEASDGRRFPEVLAARGILTGIKVDTGAKPLAGAPGETVTEGLDGLRERIERYRALGAAFAKWRAVLTIGSDKPTEAGIGANAHALGRYAALCQEGGLVPVVEPEILMGGDHDLACCYQVTHRVLARVFAELRANNVDLRAMILKPSMVMPGSSGPPAGVEDIAAATIGCLMDNVPASVPGVAFLSGGQGALLAILHLDAIARSGPHPWKVTFSFGRAIQDDPLGTWRGLEANVEEARAVLLERLEWCSVASVGAYASGT